MCIGFYLELVNQKWLLLNIENFQFIGIYMSYETNTNFKQLYKIASSGLIKYKQN